MKFGILFWWRGRARVVRAMRAAPADCPHGVLLGIEAKSDHVGVLKCIDCGMTLEMAWVRTVSVEECVRKAQLAAGVP